MNQHSLGKASCFYERNSGQNFRRSSLTKDNMQQNQKGAELALSFVLVSFYHRNFVRGVDGSGILEDFRKHLVSPNEIIKGILIGIRILSKFLSDFLLHDIYFSMTQLSHILQDHPFCSRPITCMIIKN